ncbi:sensor histidine kinase [Allosphingosinicella vermicomposti]|uniref:sensor histidine kinase n=1 Tax=Allosphingosinicella vermicomposti TaxID=614671 RepID=UPI00131A4AF0|nr:histidine kinase [Allosphingosinicella vermicomposti]
MTSVQTVIDLYYYRWLSLTLFPDWQFWATNLAPMRFVTAGFIYLWLFGLAFTLLWALGLYDVSRINAVRASASEAAALRLQLNPHFMVNALGAITSLIGTGRLREAEEVTSRLTDFLRQSLTSDPTALISLEEELATAEAYLRIEQVRSGDRLDVEITMPDALTDAAVPNFILQPLVENAVKYGVIPARAPVRITIDCGRDGEQLRISVINRRIGEDAAHDPPTMNVTSRGVGLDNIRKRLALAYGADAGLATEPLAEGYRAEIWLPFAPLENVFQP